MLDRLFIAVTTCIATASLVYFGQNQPTADASPVAAPVVSAAPIIKCECNGPENCLCTACKCLECAKPKVEPIPAPPAVKAAPIAAPKYTQPQPVAKPKAAPVSTQVLRWQPSYGPLGRERGGQWVRVPVNQARQYRAPQPTYRYYRSCSNGSCR